MEESTLTGSYKEWNKQKVLIRKKKKKERNKGKGDLDVACLVEWNQN